LTSVQRKGDGEEATQHFKVSKGNEGEGLAAEKSLQLQQGLSPHVEK